MKDHCPPLVVVYTHRLIEPHLSSRLCIVNTNLCTPILNFLDYLQFGTTTVEQTKLDSTTADRTTVDRMTVDQNDI